MSVVVVTPPTPAIDLDVVKSHLRVEFNDDDALIQAYVDAAVSHIDGPGGWLGRSVWPQTLELRQNVFGDDTRLPYGPVQSVTSIKYVDGDGAEQTVPPADYFLTGDGEIKLSHGASWPSLRGDAEGVRIRYEAGHETLPGAVLSAVLLMVGDLYNHRGSTGSETGAVQMNTTVENLLAPYRAWPL